MASDSEDEAEGEEEKESDVLVPDTATLKFANWSISYRGRWTRWGGRHSLPAATLKAAARRYEDILLSSPCVESFPARIQEQHGWVFSQHRQDAASWATR